MEAAYDHLSAPMRQFLDGLVGVNSWGDRLPDVPPVEHPLVAVNPRTGRKALYANYSYTDATFRSPLNLVAPNTPTADEDRCEGDVDDDDIACINVQRGDHLPGVPRHKFKALRRLIENQGIDNALIFCNRKREVASLRRQMERSGFSVRDIHGDLDQAQRSAALEAFKRGEIA